MRPCSRLRYAAPHFADTALLIVGYGKILGRIACVRRVGDCRFTPHQGPGKNRLSDRLAVLRVRLSGLAGIIRFYQKRLAAPKARKTIPEMRRIHGGETRRERLVPTRAPTSDVRHSASVPPRNTKTG